MPDTDLPDIPEQDYRDFQSAQFRDYAASRVADIVQKTIPEPTPLPPPEGSVAAASQPDAPSPAATPTPDPTSVVPDVASAPAPPSPQAGDTPPLAAPAPQPVPTPGPPSDAGTSSATQAAVAAGAPPANLAWARANMGRADYINWCEKFVENASGQTGQFPSALAAAQAYQQQGQLRSDWQNAQPGDRVYYGAHQENGGYGHAALYNGNGTVVSSAAAQPTPLSGYFRGPLLGFVSMSGAPPAAGDDQGVPTPVSLPTPAAMPQGDQPASLPGENFLDYARRRMGEALSGAGDAVAAVPAWLSDKAKGLVDGLPNVSGYQPDVPIDQQNPADAPAGSLASQARPDNPLLTPDRGSLGGIHAFSSELGEQAGSAVHAALPDWAKDVPGVEGILQGALNPEMAPGSATGELAGAAIGKAASAAGDVLKPAADAVKGVVGDAAANIADYAQTYLRPNSGVPAEVAPGVPSMGGAAPLPKLADVVLGPEVPPLIQAARVNSAIRSLFEISDYAAADSTRGAVYLNADMRRSWDAAAGMLSDAVQRIVPDATERAAVVTDYNNPAARAAWTPAQQAAARVWDTTQNAVFDQAKKAGVLDNYVQEYVSRIAKASQGGGPGMANFSDFTPAKLTRKTATYQDFADAVRAAGMEPVTDLADVINAHVDSVGRAVENARFVSFMKQHMEADGRPTLWTAKNAAPSDYRTVPVKGLSQFVYTPAPEGMDAAVIRQTPLRVHPDAAPAFNDLVPQTYGPIDNFISKFNRLATWGLMYNPLIHGANVAGPGMAGSTWSNALTGGALAWRTGQATLRGAPEDVLALIRAGLNTRANQEARQALFDATVTKEPGMIDALHNMPVVGGLKNASDSLLWDGIVEPYQVGTAVLLRDALQKGGRLSDALPAGLSNALANLPLLGKPFRAGLPYDQATQVAARAANTMFGELPTETLSTSARLWAGRALFARNWTLGLARTYGGALGLYRDAQLGSSAQAAMRQTLGDYVARSVLMGGASHEALNMALSGHPSWENADGHKLDIAVRDAGGGERYYAYPLFKQIQDGLGVLGVIPAVAQATGKNPLAMAYSKGSPFAHAVADTLSAAGNVSPGGSIGTGKAMQAYNAKDGPFVRAMKVMAEIAGDTSPIDVQTTTKNGPEQLEGPFGATFTPATGGVGGPEEGVSLGGAATAAVGIRERGNPSSIAADKALQLTTSTVNDLQQQGVWDKLPPAEQQRVARELHAAYTAKVDTQTFGTTKTPRSEMAEVTRRLDQAAISDAQRAQVQLQAHKALVAR